MNINTNLIKRYENFKVKMLLCFNRLNIYIFLFGCLYEIFGSRFQMLWNNKVEF